MRLVLLAIAVLVLGAYAVHGRFGRPVAIAVAVLMAVCAWLAMSSSLVFGFE